MSLRRHYLLPLSSLLLVAAVSACDGGSGDPTGTGASGAGTGTGAGGSGAAGGAGGAGGGTTSIVCDTPGSKWTPGSKAFEEATSTWGLDTLKVEGVRLNAVDFDGDGWPDLLVRRGGNAGDDFAAGGVRQTWLLRNNQKGGFEDVTEKSGIRQLRQNPDPTKGRPGEVAAFGDVDNDGDLDVFTGLTNVTDPLSPETSELLLNNGDGTFTLAPADNPFRVAAPKKDVVAGVAFVDFDRDGLLDIWVTQNSVDYVPQQDRLYRNLGGALFQDVTTVQGLKTSSGSVANLNAAKAHSNAWSAAACDLNNDGNPELLVSSYGRAPNHLWQAGGPGAAFAYTNRSIDSGYAFDDRQDWHDNESARCWCFLHPDDEDCAGVPEPMYIVCNSDDDAFRWNHDYDREVFRLGGNSGATECVDIDNDGDVDLLTGEIVHWDVGSSSDPAELLFNDGAFDTKFTRPGNEATGLAFEHEIPIAWNDGIMTGSIFDFDNDGWADVYMGGSDYPGNHGLLSHQDSPGHFEPVPIDLGIDHHRSHGSAVADFDRDGDLDIVVGHSRARCDAGEPDDCYPTSQVRFFENVIGQTGHYLQLTLKGGAGTNTSAVGARVTAKTTEFTQMRDVGGGHGHYGSQDDLTVHFGLGAACAAEVTVRWPDAALTTQTFTLEGGKRYTLTQGEEPKAVE